MPLIFSAFDNELGAPVLSRSLMVAIICYFRVLDHVELSHEGVHHSEELYHSWGQFSVHSRILYACIT